jgi:hypothetical protein
MRPIAAIPLLLLMSACATTAERPVTTPQAPSPPAGAGSAEADLEPIYGVSMGLAGVTVRVGSNGCTKASDFQTQVLDGWPAATFILRRTRPDMCRALVAGGTELTFSYETIGIAPSAALVLANPLRSDPTPGR